MQRNKKAIDLSHILQIDNYIKSLEKWLSISYHQQSHQQLSKRKQKYFAQYIKVIKPKIHKFHTVIKNAKSQDVVLYSDKLTGDNIKILCQVYRQLLKFQILGVDNYDVIKKEYEIMKDQDIQGLFGKEVVTFYKINLQEPSSNDQIRYWNAYLPVQKIVIESKVIKGKRIAKKQLGFPTANVEVNIGIQNKIKGLPSGIYLVKFKFVGSLSYYGAGFIGTNPEYENFNNKRIIEIYVCYDFGQEQFYGSNVEVTFINLIRFQGKFDSFDQFLHAMRNDIEICQQMTKKLQ